MEKMDLLVLWEKLVNRDCQELPELKDRKGLRVRKVPLVLKELLERSENQENRDPRVMLEIREL